MTTALYDQAVAPTLGETTGFAAGTRILADAVLSTRRGVAMPIGLAASLPTPVSDGHSEQLREGIATETLAIGTLFGQLDRDLFISGGEA